MSPHVYTCSVHVHVQVRNVYEQRCRDADKAEDTYNKQQSAPNTKPQDLIKVCLYVYA